MPTLANLRQRFSLPAATSSPVATAQLEECLIADTRCRMSPIQAVDRKLSMMLGRGRPTLNCDSASVSETN